LSAPVLAAAFGTTAVAITGAGIAAAAMLLASQVPALRRIEINQNTTSEPAWTDLNTDSNR
jgi:hypothetical protein